MGLRHIHPADPRLPIQATPSDCGRVCEVNAVLRHSMLKRGRGRARAVGQVAFQLAEYSAVGLQDSVCDKRGWAAADSI